MTLFGQCHSQGAGQRNAFVGRTEQLIAYDTRGQVRFGIVGAEAAQAFAVVKEPRVKKIRCLAPRLGNEFSKPKHVACQRESEEILAEPGHR